MSYLLENIYLFLIAFSCLHVFEEFVYPGGFAAEFKKMTAAINLKITNGWLVMTNLMFLGVITLTLLVNTKTFGLSVISITFINGLLHIGKSIHAKRYFPGLITAVLLYIPTGIFAFNSFGLSPVQKLICFFMGLAMHLVPYILLFFSFRINL